MTIYAATLCDRIIAAGIPIVRAFYGVRTLHPLIGAVGYIWRHGQAEAERAIASWDDTESPEFRNSPIVEVGRRGQPIRRRLGGSEGPLEYPILTRMRGEGITDYLALPMTFSDGTHNPLTFQTAAPGGFSDDDVEALQKIGRAMSLVVEAEMRLRVAWGLLDTYVGQRTGRKVLSGAIRRGTGETIPAVVWFSDLRGFTGLTDTLSPDALLAHLNAYFEIVGNAVTGAGGETLKFLGDGMLAIFEIGDDGDARERCRTALDDDAVARKAVDDANRVRGAAPEIRWGLALDLGEVYYGNVSTPDRLDFTVIGSAVNQAARLEALAATLDEPLVVSAEFAAAYGRPLRTLDTHTLKGIAAPRPVFAPAPEG
jgi:adenylate cyclase